MSTIRTVTLPTASATADVTSVWEVPAEAPCAEVRAVPPNRTVTVTFLVPSHEVALSAGGARALGIALIAAAEVAGADSLLGL